MNEDYITINRNAYDKFATQHAKRHNKLSKYDLTDADWQKIINEQLIIKKNKKNSVLEIGPGTGRMLKIFNSLGCNTTAVELSPKMIEYAKKKAPNTLFIEGNILNVNFQNNSFDVIFMGAVIHNFPKEAADKLLKLIYNWIKKDGRILIYTTIHDKSEEGLYEKEDYSGNIIRYRKKFTDEELKKMLIDNGYSIVYNFYTEEPDRNKKWVTYIIKK